LAWLIGIAFTFMGICKNAPFLISLRGTGNVVVFASCLVVIACLTRWGFWRRTGFAGRWLVLLWLLPPLSMLWAKSTFESTKLDVLKTDSALAQRLGRHFVVGYSSFDEVARLAERGLIAGVYVSHSNVAGRKPQAIKAEVAGLQERRGPARPATLAVTAGRRGWAGLPLSPAPHKMTALGTRPWVSTRA